MMDATGRSIVKRALIAALCVFAALPAAHADVLFAIGKPDGDFRDLAAAGDYKQVAAAVGQGVTYTVGQSVAERDWPYIHPGPVDNWAGGREYPYRIRFNLATVPKGVCRLSIKALCAHYGSPPLVVVDVNGKASYRYRTPAGTTDAALTDPKAGRPFDLPILIPSDRFAAGANTITLSIPQGSWMVYDSVTLEDGVAAPTTPQVSALSAVGTMLYKKDGAKAKQVLRVQFNNSGVEGLIDLAIPELGVRRSLRASQPGECLVDLLVEPVLKPTKVTVTATAAGSTARAETDLKPARKWRIFVAPSVHTDIGYTDLQPKVFDRHRDNLGKALDAARSDPNFGWNLEVGYQLDLWRRTRPGRSEELLDLMRKGRFGIQGLYLNMLTGICSGEELVRALTLSARAGLEAGFPTTMANVTDVPTVVGTMPTLLANAGYRYWAEGINEDRGPVFRYADARQRQAPFWWEGPDGSRVLALFAGGYAQAAGLGLQSSVDDLAARLAGWLPGFDRPDYVGDCILVYGGVSDNAPIEVQISRTAAEWNAQYAYPQIIIGRTDQFFATVEKEFGKRLPVFRGDMGVYWEDGAGSSAFETALTRYARTRLQAAEMRSALNRAAGRGEFADEAVAQAWENVLFFDEHTWGAHCSISQPEIPFTLDQWRIKRQFAVDAAAQSDKLYDANLGTPASGARQVAVRNTVGWKRSMVASVALPSGWQSAVVRALPSGRVSASQVSGGRVHFVATGVPSLGSSRFEIAPGSATRPAAELLRQVEGGAWAAGGVRFAIDAATGAIASLRTGASKREWVRSGSAYKLNQYVYVLGGGNDSGMVHPFLPKPKLDVSTHAASTARVVENGPIRGVLCVERTGGGVDGVTTYITVDALGGFRLTNVLHKTATYTKEAGYFAFPFNVGAGGPVRSFIDLPYGIVEAENGQMAGACREWYSAVSFAASTDGKATACVSTSGAPLMTLNDVWRGDWRGSIAPLTGDILSYAFNNYWHTNYKASQEGDLVLEYGLSLTDGGFDPTAATRFGWERLASAPDPRVTVDTLPGGDAGGVAAGSPVPEPRVEVSGAALLGGVTWQDGGLSVRLFNPSGRPVVARVSVPGLAVASARKTDLAGRPNGALTLEGGVVRCSVPARGLATVALTPQR
jgi:hypothetical protein